MLRSLLNTLRRISSDLTSGRNLEAYAIALIALIFAIVLLLSDTLPQEVQMAVLLAGVGLLVFKTTSPPEKPIDLDSVMRDRQEMGNFREFIRGAKQVDIYAPSAVNVLTSSPDIEHEVLERGGNLRIILQDPDNEAAIAMLHDQLDKMSFLLEKDIDRSLSVLTRLSEQHSKVNYRLLSYSPGFSLVVVDAKGRNGRLVVEFFGFGGKDITERMHLLITRDQSQYWFEYFASQFEEMWAAARELS